MNEFPEQPENAVQYVHGWFSHYSLLNDFKLPKKWLASHSISMSSNEARMPIFL